MSPSSPLQRLSPGTAQRLPTRSATVLGVVCGRLWVTVAGDLSDYFVPAGESLALPGGDVVIEADQGVPAVYALTPGAGGRVR